MSIKNSYNILLTNDDGIQSDGLLAAAEALSGLGNVTVVAPREEVSASGRSMPPHSDEKVERTKLIIGGEEWTGYAIGGTPGQAVLYAILNIMPIKPDLVVSGINAGENVGDIITTSGTVCAAIEAASNGVPGLAVSRQIHNWEEFVMSGKKADYSTAAFFTRYFAELMLTRSLPNDVDLLKVDVPEQATPQTPWRITRQAKHRYYIPFIDNDGTAPRPGKINVKISVKPGDTPHDSDVHTLAFEKMVSVTPLSIDLTSRVDLAKLEEELREV